MIYCIGDSFTYGDELDKPEKDAWPVVLGKMLNKSVTNLGKPGTGNTRMVKRAIDVAFQDDAELVIISWTNPTRIEFFNTQPYDVWPGRQVWPQEDANIAKALTIMHNEYFDMWLYRKWLRDIILTQNLLKSQNKRYLMAQALHYSDNHDFAHDLWKKVDIGFFLYHPQWSDVNKYETFCHWTKDNAKAGQHPSETGHQQIAEKFYEYIRHLGWLS